MRDTANIQLTSLTDQLQWTRGRNYNPRTMVPLQDRTITPFNPCSMNPVGAENRMTP